MVYSSSSTCSPSTEMDFDWDDIAINTAYLTADLAMIGGGGNDEKHNPKYIRERKNRQKKKQQSEQSQDDGFEMSM